MEYRIRAFNVQGISFFQNHLNSIRFNGVNTNIDRAILFDDIYSDELKEELFVEDQQFLDKYDFAKYISGHIDLSKNKHFYYHIGLWTWLSAFYFEQVCPLESNVRKPGQDARHILQEPKDFRTYYRHLLAGPARIYSELKEKGRIFLAGDLSKRGDIVEQLQAYQNIGLNRGIIEAADQLYWDEGKNRLKKGSGSKGAGSPRRFVNIIGQFELTYDLNSMEGARILELFPDEFKKWTAS